MYQQNKTIGIMTTKFNVKVGQTLNILHDGIQRTAIVVKISKCQIDVRFWNDELKYAYRSFTTFGLIRYLKSENSKILSLSL